MVDVSRIRVQTSFWCRLIPGSGIKVISSGDQPHAASSDHDDPDETRRGWFQPEDKVKAAQIFGNPFPLDPLAVPMES